jgi:hypothetical protein
LSKEGRQAHSGNARLILLLLREMNLEIISSVFFPPNLADLPHWLECSDTFMEPECKEEMFVLMDSNNMVGLHYWFSTQYVVLICRIGALCTFQVALRN